MVLQRRMHLRDVLRLMGGLSEMMCCSCLERRGLAPAVKITSAPVSQAELPGGEDMALGQLPLSVRMPAAQKDTLKRGI